MLEKLEKFSGLVQAQILYGRSILLSGLTLLGLAGLGVTLFLSNERAMGKSWAVMILFAGMVMSVVLWSQDMRERRQLSWMTLPISPGLNVASRVAVPIFVHAAILIPFLAFIPLWISQPESDPARVFERVFGVHGFSLMMSLMIYISEEVTIWVYRWGKLGVIAFNILILGVVFFSVVLGGRFGLPEMDSVSGIVMTYSASLVLTVWTVVLYIRRSNYLVGIDACTSMPVDWGTSRS